MDGWVDVASPPYLPHCTSWPHPPPSLTANAGLTPATSLSHPSPATAHLLPPSPLSPIPPGTANGGSALLWASLFHLYGMEEAKVITLDIASPVWEPGHHWGGHSREDPTQHALWKKHVTFLKVGWQTAL